MTVSVMDEARGTGSADVQGEKHTVYIEPQSSAPASLGCWYPGYGDSLWGRPEMKWMANLVLASNVGEGSVNFRRAPTNDHALRPDLVFSFVGCSPSAKPRAHTLVLWRPLV